MAEQRAENEKIRLQFRNKDFLYSIPKGMALVKRNYITGSIKVVGKTNETRVTQIDKVIHLHDDYQASDQFLVGLISNAHIPVGIKANAQAELDYRTAKRLYEADPNTNPKPQSTDDLRNATMKIRTNIPELISRRVKAKTGIRIRWPWQSALVLNLQEQALDSAPVSIDTNDRIRLLVDTDYRYEIVDPVTYASRFNGLTQQYGKNASKELEKLISQDLDQLVINYVRVKGSNTELNNVSLFDACQPEIMKIGEAYGIDIKKILIVKVNYPNEIVDAETKLKAAKSAAAAELAAKKVEQQEAALKMSAIFDSIKKQFPNLTDEQIMDKYISIQQAQTVTTNFTSPINLGVPTQPGQQPVQQQPVQPVQPGQQQPYVFPDGLERYVGLVFAPDGTIAVNAWQQYIAANPNTPYANMQGIPTVDMLSEDVVKEIFAANGLNNPYRTR